MNEGKKATSSNCTVSHLPQSNKSVNACFCRQKVVKSGQAMLWISLLSWSFARKIAALTQT